MPHKIFKLSPKCPKICGSGSWKLTHLIQVLLINKAVDAAVYRLKGLSHPYWTHWDVHGYRPGAVQQNGRKQLVLLEPRKPTGTNTCGNHKDSHGSEVSNLEILYIHHRPWWKNLANSFFNNKNHINITSRTHLFSRSTLRQTGRSVRSGSGRIEKSKVSPFPHPLIKGLGWCTGKAGSIFLSWKSLILVTSTAK